MNLQNRWGFTTFMTILIIALLVLCLYFSSSMLVRKINFYCAFIFILAVGCGFVPRLMLNCLQNTPNQPINWGKQNIIILLGAGTEKINQLHQVAPNVLAYSRLFTTAKYYHLCKQQHEDCKILISGGDPQHHSMSEAEVYQNGFLDLGIAKSDILLEDKSLNTYQNAEFSAKILKDYPNANLILVTSGIHLKRSKLLFAHFNLQPQLIAADSMSAPLTIIPNSYNFLLTDIALHEYIGKLQFYVYNFLKLND